MSMIQRLLIMLLFALGIGTASAHYTLHTVSGDVKVESGGKTVAAAKGQAVKATDYVIIPQGGKVEILNDLDKRIYTSIKPGKISVTKLMIEARGLASDNGANVASRMNIAGAPKKGKEKVFEEKGMVRRSQLVYDPDAEDCEMSGEASPETTCEELTVQEELGRELAASVAAWASAMINHITK